MFESAAMLAGDTTPVARFDFGTSVPNGFVFSPDGRYLYGSSYYTGVSNIFRYDLRVEEARGGDQHRDRLLPAGAAGRRPADRVPLHGRGLRADADRPQAARGRQRDHVPRRAAGRGASGAEDLDARLAGQGAVRHDGEDARASTASPAACDASRSIPIVQGYKDTAAVGMAFNLSDPLQFNRLRLTAGWSPGRRSRRPASALHLSARVPALRLARQRGVQRRRFLRSVRPDEDGPQGLSARWSAHRPR